MSTATALEWPTPEEQEILRGSLLRMIPSSDVVAQRFYDHLFDANPGVRPMFPEDMKPQEDKFMMMLASMLDELADPETAKASLRKLGRKHYEYGALPAHYAPVKDSLVVALLPVLTEYELGLWGKLYDLMADLMIEG